SSANTAQEGVFIFGGSKGNQPPFVKAADSTVSYQGSSTGMSFQVSRTMTLETQLPGDEIFTGSVDIFSTIDSLTQAMQAGDTDAIGAQVKKLENFAEVLSTARSRVGSSLNVVDSLTNVSKSSGLLRAQQLDHEQSADMAKAISELTQG